MQTFEAIGRVMTVDEIEHCLGLKYEAKFDALVGHAQASALKSMVLSPGICVMLNLFEFNFNSSLQCKFCAKIWMEFISNFWQTLDWVQVNSCTKPQIWVHGFPRCIGLCGQRSGPQELGKNLVLMFALHWSWFHCLLQHLWKHLWTICLCNWFGHMACNYRPYVAH